MKTTIHTKYQWALRIAALLGLLLTIVPVQPGRAADPPVKLFLPLITKPFVGISGRVTFNGAVPKYTEVELCYWVDSQTGDCPFSYNLNSEGYYYFPASWLTPGRSYFVGFFNYFGTDEGMLDHWFTRELEPYVANSNIVMETFDIADVTLLSPASGATVSLPYVFQWTKRPASPSDSYRFRLYEPSTNNSFYSAPLGYIDSFQLDGLPAGFSPNKAYRWTIWVYSPDGGSGVALTPSTITFSNSGSASLPGFTSGGGIRHYRFDGKDYLIP